MKYFFINLILGLFFSLPNWFLRLFFWKKSKFIRDNHLDQQTRIFLKLLDIFGYKLDTDNFSSIERIRSNNARMSLNINKKPSEKISFNKIFINKDKSVFMREYKPLNTQSDQALLFFHGGGYALGSVETHHNFVASMSLFLGTKVYSLEYGLSPENKFPNALEDARKAYLVILQEFENKKILLCGDSAGAHLAASLSYDLDQSNIPAPLAQVLIYPMVCPSLNFESMELFKKDFLLTKSSMKWFWDQLRSNEYDNENPRFDLLKQEGMISVPRTLIITAGFDPLYDEGSAYANLLEKKGGKVMRLHFEDLIHGFVNLTNLRKANSATTKIFETIKKHLT